MFINSLAISHVIRGTESQEFLPKKDPRIINNLKKEWSKVKSPACSEDHSTEGGRAYVKPKPEA